MIIRVPLGTAVEIRNAIASEDRLDRDQQPMTMAEWSTLSNICGAFMVNGVVDEQTTKAITQLREKCIARMIALSHGVVLP